MFHAWPRSLSADCRFWLAALVTLVISGTLTLSHFLKGNLHGIGAWCLGPSSLALCRELVFLCLPVSDKVHRLLSYVFRVLSTSMAVV